MTTADQNLKYPFPVRQRVLWGEMDAFNHVNNVTYFRYFETGRVHFMYESGLWKLLLEEGIQIVVGKLECKFIQPLFYPDDIEISVAFKSLGTTSMVVHQKVTSLVRGLAAEGDAIIVCTDPATGKKKPLTDKVRAAIEALM